MNFEIKGNAQLKLDGKKAIEINAKKEEKIVINIRKIGGIKKLFKIIKALTEDETENKDSGKEFSEKKEITEILNFLKDQGYSVSIKLKGITIIKDLQSSSLAKLMNFI